MNGAGVLPRPRSCGSLPACICSSSLAKHAKHVALELTIVVLAHVRRGSIPAPLVGKVYTSTCVLLTSLQGIEVLLVV